MTKPVTAAAALKLVERGLIRLDDPVEKYLPFFTPRYPSPHSRRITVADLLNHSSGLPSNEPWVVSWVHGEDEPALDQTVFIRRRLPDFDRLGFEPGSRASYTNMDYYVLAAVIERASGRPYREYVADEVLRPLGMHDTGFAYTPAMCAHESAGSLDLASAQTAFLPLVRPLWPTEFIRGYQDGRAWFERFLFDGDAASGLIGSAPDMARFVAALLDEGKLDGSQVLSASTAATMLDSRQVAPAASPETAGYPAGALKTRTRLVRRT